MLALTRTVMGPAARLMTCGVSRRLRRYLEHLGRCAEVQEARLRQIVRAGQGSDFAVRHGLDRVRSYEDFVRAVPVSEYAYVRPYIDRCLEGDTRALLGPSQRLVMFALTSGTTGSSKAIPITQEFVKAYRFGWDLWGIKAVQDHPALYWGTILQVSSPHQEYRSAAGVPCGAISGLLARTQNRIIRGLYAVPWEVAEIPDPERRYYAILRFALAKDIRWIVTANPSTLVALAQTGLARASSLIRDLHDGTLEGLADLAPHLRSALGSRLRRHRTRARALEAVLDTHAEFLPRHYWRPDLLSHWTGGTVGLYVPQVRRLYGQVPVRDIGLLASEARMSLPLADDTCAGVLEIAANMYEFIPESEVRDLAPAAATLAKGVTLLRAHEVEVGAVYSLVLTTGAGLYRYHLGDQVRVTDRIGSTPVIEFLSRGAHTSSLTGEKLTEHQVVTAVTRALAETGLEVGLFTLAPVWAEPPYYRLSVEVSQPLPEAQADRLALRVDALLAGANCEYTSKRQTFRLGSVRISSVTDRGLSRGDWDLIVARGGRSEQFKHRFLVTQPWVQEGKGGTPGV